MFDFMKAMQAFEALMKAVELLQQITKENTAAVQEQNRLLSIAQADKQDGETQNG